MILLLGGSGYVGRAYQKLLDRIGVPFHNLTRAEVDYTDAGKLGAFLAGSGVEFVLNCAGYTGKPNVDACEDDKANVPRSVTPCCLGACARRARRHGHAVGPRFQRLHLYRHAARRRGVPGGGRAEFFVSHEPLQLLQRDQGAGRGSARRGGGMFRLAAADSRSTRWTARATT